jgi:lysozyme
LRRREPGVTARLTILAIAVVGIAVVALARGLYPRLEPAALWYDVIGVDVSHHQGAIDWGTLKAGGVAFAYIKATEGSRTRDREFQGNWRGATAAGMPRGAYHYLSWCQSGRDQAQNFIRTVPRDAGTLPPALDAEEMAVACPGGHGVDIVAEIDDFLKTVETHYGRRPVVYVTAGFYVAYLEGKKAGTERFWVRSLLLPPAIERGHWQFWQFHNRGRRTASRDRSISTPTAARRATSRR